MKSWAIAGAATVLMALTAPAHAAVVLEFEPESGPVGERVLGSSDESGVPIDQLTDLKIFLAPSPRIADRARGPRDPRLTSFGTLRVDDEGVARFSGTVPDIAPSHYVAVAYCRSCISGGSTFTVGEFTVSGASLPATGSPSDALIWIAFLLLATGAVVWIQSRAPGFGRS